jgi:hypothetical protein
MHITCTTHLVVVHEAAVLHQAGVEALVQSLVRAPAAGEFGHAERGFEHTSVCLGEFWPLPIVPNRAESYRID